jgi:hypothetical protein
MLEACAKRAKAQLAALKKDSRVKRTHNLSPSFPAEAAFFSRVTIDIWAVLR